MRLIWEEAVSFHGHACPGLAQGLRASLLALKLLGVERAEDEELVVCAENDACGVDAIQVITGCTVGKGNLLLLDYGKPAYTFYSRQQGRGVRIVALPPTSDEGPQVELNGASTVDVEAQRRQATIERLLSSPLEQGFRVEEVEVAPPEPTRIFKSIICEACGERVMEPRARISDGKVVCLPCHRSYAARWWSSAL